MTVRLFWQTQPILIYELRFMAQNGAGIFLSLHIVNMAANVKKKRSAFVQGALHRLCITFIHRCKAPASTPGAIRGSVSYSRTLQRWLWGSPGHSEPSPPQPGSRVVGMISHKINLPTTAAIKIHKEAIRITEHNVQCVDGSEEFAYMVFISTIGPAWF